MQMLIPPLASHLPHKLSFRSDFKQTQTRFHLLWLSPPASPFSPAFLPSPTAQVVQFQAHGQVHVPFTSGSLPPEAYLKNVERVVRVASPESTRIRRLGNSLWRAHLKPVAFFGLSVSPVCDLSVYHENSAVKMCSNKLVLFFDGAPDQFNHLDMKFSLLGQLSVPESSTSGTRNTQNKIFEGRAKLALELDLPLPFSMMPPEILTPIGDGILKRILDALHSALLADLIRDYNSWCTTQSDEPSPSSNAKFIMNG